jgi:phage terminase large subunit-like protein
MRSVGAQTLRAAFAASSEAASEFLAGLDAADLERLAYDWQLWAHDSQLPPAVALSNEAWRTWLFLGGRGAGKTRAGAEWVRAQALGLEPFATTPARRIALVGPTQAHVRAVMIEGISGLLAIHPAAERPLFHAGKGELVWPNGAIAQIYSAEDGESLRGPQFEIAWCDELCRWRRPVHTWDMLQLALRLGDNPRAAITTTPKNLALLKRLIADPSTVTTHATTADNGANLAATFVAAMTRRYGGTALGLQELDGQIVDEPAGSLWRRTWIEQGRAARAPELKRVVVAVDPPVTATAQSDSCGIVVAGLGVDNRAYVLDDRTIKGREPIVWARAAIAAYRDFHADRIVAEGNQGGDLVTSVLRQVDPSVPVKIVRASRGKFARAEPVAALYAEGRVVHVGEHNLLEAQLFSFGPDGLPGERSPDRLDALVWAITELLITVPREPTVRTL